MGGTGDTSLPRHVVRRLTRAEGGGFLVEFPDHPGCIADGATLEEAISEAQDAWHSYRLTMAELKDRLG